MKNLDSLQKALGYSFRDERLLRLALTHPSAGLPEDNQRLEFLGDAVLQLCVSVALYGQHPADQEGSLTQLRQALVREETLAEAANRLEIGEYLRFDKGEAASGGGHKRRFAPARSTISPRPRARKTGRASCRKRRSSTAVARRNTASFRRKARRTRACSRRKCCFTAPSQAAARAARKNRPSRKPRARRWKKSDKPEKKA